MDPTQAGLIEGVQAPELDSPLTNQSIVEGAAGDGDQPTNVTKEEQDAYDRTVIAAKKIMYNPDMVEDFANLLKANRASPAQAVADTTAMLITQIDEKAGNQIPDEVILPASMEIMADLIEMGHEGNLFSMTDSDITAALQATVGEVAIAYGATQEDIEEMMQEFGDDPKVVAGLEEMFKTHTTEGGPAAKVGGGMPAEGGMPAAGGMPPPPADGGLLSGGGPQ